MEVDHEIMKEAKEKETPSSEHGQEISREEDHVTIAQITQTLSTLAPSTPMPNPSSSGKKKRSKVKKEKLLQVKKSHFASKPRNAVSGHDGKCTSSKKEKIALHTLLGEAKSSAMIRAKEVQSNLEAEFPSFVKLMVRSQVTKGFWMGLPIAFCKSHLPRKDIMVRLEDEHGGTYEARFLADKTGLSAGWRQFSIGHKLLEGDVLVFQLVEPSKFKVVIIRENELTEVDEGHEALTLLNLDAHSKQNDQDDAEMGAVVCNNMKRKRSPKSLPLAIVQEKIKWTGMHRQPRTVRKLGKTTEQSENDSENVSSAVQPVSGRSFMAVDLNEEVLKGGEEKGTLSSEAGQAISQEDDITLAQISQTPRTFAPSTPKPNPSSSGKQKKSKVEKEILLPIKKGRLASKSRNAISEQAQKGISCTTKKAAAHTPGQAKSSAMIRAEEVQSNLESEYPSFIKSMLRSHVSSCFWMGLPGPFCKSHLPRKETMVILKDERGGTYEVKFIPEKAGLSGGWKHFSVGHKLLEGDVLVFQLIEPQTKVCVCFAGMMRRPRIIYFFTVRWLEYCGAICFLSEEWIGWLQERLFHCCT